MRRRRRRRKRRRRNQLSKVEAGARADNTCFLLKQPENSPPATAAAAPAPHLPQNWFLSWRSFSVQVVWFSDKLELNLKFYSRLIHLSRDAWLSFSVTRKTTTGMHFCSVITQIQSDSAFRRLGEKSLLITKRLKILITRRLKIRSWDGGKIAACLVGRSWSCGSGDFNFQLTLDSVAFQYTIHILNAN